MSRCLARGQGLAEVSSSLLTEGSECKRRVSPFVLSVGFGADVVTDSTPLVCLRSSQVSHTPRGNGKRLTFVLSGDLVDESAWANFDELVAPSAFDDCERREVVLTRVELVSPAAIPFSSVWTIKYAASAAAATTNDPSTTTIIVDRRRPPVLPMCRSLLRLRVCIRKDNGEGQTRVTCVQETMLTRGSASSLDP